MIKLDNSTGTLGEIVDIRGGNSSLTKNKIYYNMPEEREKSIPVYSGSTSSNNVIGYLDIDKVRDIRIYQGPAIIICRKGKSGKMRYIKDNLFTINDDAYVMYVKDKYCDKVNLKWLSFSLQKLFYTISTAKEANGTFSKRYAEKQIVDIPDMDKQIRQIYAYESLYKYKDILYEINSKLDSFLGRIHTSKDMKEYTISDIFYLDTGKRITKNIIYNNLYRFIGRKDIIPIISSGTTNNGIFAYTSKDWLNETYRRKKVIESKWIPWKNFKGASFIINTPCITWNTDGDAGSLFYREYEFFPTDHCGVLIPKEEFNSIINLKYFVYTQKYSFKQNSDRGNLHKEQMANLKFELPDINIQNKICEKINKIIEIKQDIDRITKVIEELETLHIY